MWIPAWSNGKIRSIRRALRTFCMQPIPNSSPMRIWHTSTTITVILSPRFRCVNHTKPLLTKLLKIMLWKFFCLIKIRTAEDLKSLWLSGMNNPIIDSEWSFFSIMLYLFANAGALKIGSKKQKTRSANLSENLINTNSKPARPSTMPAVRFWKNIIPLSFSNIRYKTTLSPHTKIKNAAALARILKKRPWSRTISVYIGVTQLDKMTRNCYNRQLS